MGKLVIQYCLLCRTKNHLAMRISLNLRAAGVVQAVHDTG